MIIKAIGTGNLSEAMVNLRFLVAAELIEDPNGKIVLATNNPDTTPVLPRPVGPPGSSASPLQSLPPNLASKSQAITPNLLEHQVVLAAASQVGVREDPLGSNRGPMVDEYLKSAGLHVGTGWSVAFVYWCFDQASKKYSTGNPLPRTASANAMVTNFDPSRIRLITPESAINDPSQILPGMAFFLDFGGGMGHAGIVESRSGDSITTIEGNSNDDGSRQGVGVFRKTRKIDKFFSLGFLAPL
ncbi:CHAP domain-containing protein [Variovorax rhizosphaerae]|uniref:CHAP domain-containing protein n=1 Tax=Variovorax rhizosphaerae TaxID=1836200 RepID=A0ABU8WDN6_9BURK